jgi:hypothetical protein
MLMLDFRNVNKRLSVCCFIVKALDWIALKR